MIYIALGVALLAAWVALVRVDGRPWLTAVLRLVLPGLLLWGMFARGSSTVASSIIMYLVFLAVPLLISAYLFSWLKARVATKLYVGPLAVASVVFGVAFLLHFRLR